MPALPFIPAGSVAVSPDLRNPPPYSPPPKRARYFPPDQDYDCLAPGPASHAYWFEDGDLVLGVDDLFFKIHTRRFAACSGVFADLLHLPKPVVIESVDGCPFVRLSDSAKDWIITLEFIYDPYTFQNRPVIFDSLAGALRISTKYDIRPLRNWATSQLRSTWPLHLDQMGPMALPHAAEAIALARACEVPEILAAAFYALSVQKWRAGADGGRSHLVLSQSDMRRLIAGREALQDILVDIMSDPLPRTLSASDFFHHPTFTSNPNSRAGTPSSPMLKPNSAIQSISMSMSYEDAPSPAASTAASESSSDSQPSLDFEFCLFPCRPRLEAFWRARLAPDSTRPWGTWLLRELHRMAMVPQGELVDPVSGMGPVCTCCWEEHRRLALCRLGLLKEAIPRLFML